MKIRNLFLSFIGTADPGCPDEANVLAYFERRLSGSDRARIERHFANCPDCMRILAFLGREVETPVALSNDGISEQTAKVLAHIQTDERNRRNAPQKVHTRSASYNPYLRLATVALIPVVLIFCVIAITYVTVTKRGPSPADAAMAALRLSFKDARSTEARISGGFDHSRYVGTTRGGPNNADDLNLSRAENKVKAAAEQPNATVEDRHTLARVYLARETSEYARKALAIINQLIAGGVETAEVLNDKAVALFQLGEYDEAVAFFSEALAKSPAYNEALFNRALVEGHTGRNEDARRDWNQFISESRDEKWKAEAQSRLNSLDGSSDR